MSDKTIVMKRADANKWLKGLRSGEYEQTTEGELCYNGKHCCMGVMQEELAGKVQKYRQLPSVRWLRDHNIKANLVIDKDSDSEKRNCSADISITPVKSKKSNRMLTTLSELNDSGEFTFEEIADIIESNLKKV